MRVDPNYVSNLTAAVDQSASEEDTLTSELSSGLRVASLSDDPVAVAQSTLLGSSIAKDDTFVQTASGEVFAVAGCGFDSGRGGHAGDFGVVYCGCGQQWDAQCERSRQRCSKVERDSRPGAFACEHELPGAVSVWWKSGVGATVYARYHYQSCNGDL